MPTLLTLVAALAVPAVIWLLAGRVINQARAADLQDRINRWRWPAKGE